MLVVEVSIDEMLVVEVSVDEMSLAMLSIAKILVDKVFVYEMCSC